MFCRELNKSKDYGTVSQWWKAREWPIIPLEYLPNHGLIIDNYCAGFVYNTDSAIAWIEFIVSNPNSDKVKRSQAMDILIDSLIGKARILGAKCVFTSSNNEKLIKRFVSQGYSIADRNVTHLMRGV